MTDTRGRVRALRRAGMHAKKFVPEGSLEEYLTLETIREVLKRCKFDSFELKSIEESICAGGRKILAILILMRQRNLVLKFHEASCLVDAKLPFSADQLEFISKKIDVEEFLELQWEFISPVFGLATGHRLLQKQTILPFSQEEYKGEGAFGLVSRSKIYARHLGRPSDASDEAIWIVRKELRVRNEELSDEFGEELRVLSYLKPLSHPNIYQLLGSYTHEGTHTFLFPCASGDLKEFLQSGQSPEWFTSETTWYIALARLSSALECVHNYASAVLDISFIGCHHDIKPSNILVEKDRLILADFGLSRLKPLDEDSRSDFKAGQDDYRAPESQDVMNAFENGKVSRPADIWSFGCILMEILTYIRHGRQGIDDFSQRRRVKLETGIIWRRFHCGNSVNAGVESYLEELEKDLGSDGRRFLQLAKDMTRIEPSERLTIRQVKERLRQIALFSLYRVSFEEYDLTVPLENSIEVEFERMRFKAWGWAAGLAQTEGARMTIIDSLLQDDSAFEDAVTRISAIRNELAALRTDSDSGIAVLRLAVFQLRTANDRLFSMLPSTQQRQATNRLELELLNADNVELLESCAAGLPDTRQNERIKALTAIRKMVTSIDNHSDRPETELEKRHQHVNEPRALGLQERAVMDKDEGTRVPVLLEHIYIHANMDDNIRRELRYRVIKIANLLHSQQSESTLRVLRCVGFYMNPTRLGFSLVFSFPETHDEKEHQPVTLHRMLGDPVPLTALPLERRFQISYSIAKSVSEFHKVGWLHKSISPFNVLFFATKNPDARTSHFADDPYLIGFNHCRPDDPNSFSEGLDPDIQNRYQHPKYGRDVHRYCPAFDYYSLGLVLLELGLWKPLEWDKLSTKDESDAQDPKALHREICDELVPGLDQHMGTRYRMAVETCLTGFETEIEDSDNSTTVKQLFIQNVVEPLGALSTVTAVV